MLFEKDAVSNGQTVIGCLDGSTYTQAVTDYSVWLAEQLQQSLAWLHVIEPLYDAPMAELTGALGVSSGEQLLVQLAEFDKQRNQLAMQKGHALLELAKKEAEQRHSMPVDTIQRRGSLVESLIELEHRMSMVVLGIRGDQAEQENQTALGTHLESVIRALHHPVFVVNSNFVIPKSLMLAFDGSECCLKAVTFIQRSALFKKMSIHLVQVAKESTSVRQRLDEVVAGFDSSHHLAAVKVIDGEPITALCDYQQKADVDLVVMGAFSHHRLREMMFGSRTHKMLQTTNKPLLLLR